MADSKLTEQQVADLVTVVRGDANLDAKVNYVNTIKSGIKQHNVPDICVPQLFDGLRLASASQHTALVNVGFTALNHLLTRLSRQDSKMLGKEAARTLPLIVEKLGDQKDKIKATALQSLTTLYGAAPQDVERVVRSSAMTGKNPRAKEAAMQWLLQAHQEQGLQFRGYVPTLMELLEDADGMVRDAAKGTVIELFKSAPNAAKSDLKRQLKNFKVRPAIEQAIVKALAPTGTRPETPSEAPLVMVPSRPALSASTSTAPLERPITPSVDTRDENIEPMYVNTNRELDDIFKEMAWFFEGRESEQNWLKREQSIGKLRKLNAGNAVSDFPDTFIAGLRAMLDGIIKAVSSLRTSLFKETCGLIQDFTIAFGPGIDPMVEMLLQTVIKLCAGTKKIGSQLADVVVTCIISRVTYTPRIMQHVWGACGDKNVQPRTYAAGWLKIIINKESGHKSHVEHSGGVDLMEKSIKKGLGDPIPGVREKMRPTFWVFHSVWPARANAIMEDLDSTAQKLLQKSSPNSPKKAEAARPGLGLSKSTMTASKPSLRETMMAQKKASMAAKNLPARPGSAMAHLSPVRKTSADTPSHPKEPLRPTGGRVRPDSNTISVHASGMSVAPVRPRRRPDLARPELVARPATAGPYSVRDQPSAVESDSPRAMKSKTMTPKVKEASPARRTAQRPKPGHASHASESSIQSPTARVAVKPVPSPRISPAKLKASVSADVALSSSPTRRDEEMTLVVPPAPTFQPISQPLQEEPRPLPELPSSPKLPLPELSNDDSQVTDAFETLKVYEDPFTEAEATPKLTYTAPVLEDKPVNEDAAKLQNGNTQPPVAEEAESPEKVRQNSRLLDSGITKIKTKSLEVHGFRKLQSLLRDNKTTFTDERFETLVLGLFQYLEDPLSNLAADKAQDVKAQILATIKLLLKKERANFEPHVSKCLESLLQTRSVYDSRAHIVSGLELLANDLVSLGDAAEIVAVLGRHLEHCTDESTEGCRTLSMGLHVLKEMLDKRSEPVPPSEAELAQLSALAGRCLESTDSGVRMDAVQLCVALHAGVGEPRFWDALSCVKDDPKSLITYYIVKRQREQGIIIVP